MNTKTTLTAIALVSAAFMTLVAANGAWSQTKKDQCATLARSVQKLTGVITVVETATDAIKWEPVIAGTSGEMKASASEARDAQLAYQEASRRYTRALSDFGQFVQNCAF